MKSISLFKSKNTEVDRKTIVRDRPIKSVVKAITWRIVGTLDTILISFILTGKPVIAFTIGGVEIFTKIFLYYLHERLWENIRWGRMLVVMRKGGRSARKSITRIFIRPD